MKNLLKIMVLATTFITLAGIAIAKELVVTGTQANDLKLITQKAMPLTTVLIPCMSQQPQNADLSTMYYNCVCKANNTAAIQIYKSMNDIVNRNPNWKDYSQISTPPTKIGNMTTSQGLNIDNFKTVIKAISPCLK